MKRTLLGLAFLVVVPSEVQADCHRERMQACAAYETGKPDASRGGMSLSQFCAADAVVACSAAVQSQPRNYEDRSSAKPAYEPVRRQAEAPVKPAPDTKRLSEIVAPLGKLRIFQGDGYGSKAYIRYNDNVIHEFDGVYLSIGALLSVGSNLVLIYSTNPGGSGTPDSYGLVSVDHRGQVYTSELPVGSGRFEYNVGFDRISFELGITDGKEVRAIYATGRLDVTRTRAPMTGLSAQDCDMLYNGYLDECASTRQTACAGDVLQDSISMASQRPVNMLAADNPNFRRPEFDTICEKTCRDKKKPSLASFRKQICLPK